MGSIADLRPGQIPDIGRDGNRSGEVEEVGGAGEHRAAVDDAEQHTVTFVKIHRR